jgi:filamentous hemagglutinin family protein
MKIDRFLSAKLVLISLPILLTFGTKGAIAQITPANDGTGTVVNGTQQLNITGGTQAGGNLFHSFQQFGVNAGQTANFLSNPNTQNILGRVTGGNASLINGLLQVSGSNANLYLINPAGIVFGKNASLNVPAAFTATTANGIGFGNGQWFNAIGSNNYASLTANPTSFGFSGLSGPIVNAGNLSVNPGKSIALVGGTVVNTGTISAPGGNITIAAIPGEKLVRIGQDGTILSLDLPTIDKTLINAPIATPLSLPALLTGGTIPSAMGVVVEDGVVKLTAGSAAIAGNVSADGVGTQKGGNVVAYADNYLNFTGTISAKGGEFGGNGGFVDTSGKGQINIAPNAKVVTTAANGLTGNWVIDPADLEVVAGSGGATIDASGLNDQSLSASTIGADTIVSALNGTNVNLTASNSITVSAAIDASGNGNTGNLTLNAPTANLNQAITLNAASGLNGTATTVNVGANGTVQNGVDVAADSGTVNLAAATYTLNQAVDINKNLTVKGAGSGSTIVSGNDAVQGFIIYSGRTVTLDGMSIVKGKNAGNAGGGILNLGTLTVNNSTLSGNNAANGGGILNSSTGTLTVNNSTLSGNNATTSGGGIYNDKGTLTVNNSTLSGNNATTSGGGISNDTGTLTVKSSIVSGNTAPTGREINSSGGTVVSNGYNLFGYSGNNGVSGIPPVATDITPSAALSEILAPLGNYGGPTQTHALLPGSPAIDAGDIATTTADQRGVTPVGIRDIGAYESKGFALSASNATQSTTVNTAFANPLKVNLVETSFNSPLPGATINFTKSGSLANATLNPTTAVITDSTGAAQVVATANTKAGSYIVQANAIGITGADFNLTNIADIANAIVTTSGSNQTAIVDQPFASNLRATVTDKFGNPVQGSTVTFSLPGTGLSGVSGTNTAMTDATGTASISFKANTKAGSFTTTGTVGGVATGADFNLTNIADSPNAIVTSSGSGQTAIVDQPFASNLRATVTDKFGNPVQGSTVTFSLPGIGLSGVSGTNTAMTDATGTASISFKANTKAGSFTTTGTVDGVTTGADFNLTNISRSQSQSNGGK